MPLTNDDPLQESIPGNVNANLVLFSFKRRKNSCLFGEDVKAFPSLKERYPGLEQTNGCRFLSAGIRKGNARTHTDREDT